MNHIPEPHEIRRPDGSPAYSCRGCNATENLHWFGDTSCPVCSKPECHKKLSDEWNAAYQALGNEGEEP